MNKRAFTLVEMLISMIVAAIMMLMVGKLSDIAMSSSKNLRRQAELFSEIMHGYKYMQKYVREAGSCITVPPSGSWVGNRLECLSSQSSATNPAFGVWNNAGIRQFVYVPDRTDTTVRTVLFEVPITATLPDNDLTFTPTLISGMVNVTIEGNKDNIPFDLTSSIRKRS